MLQKIKISLTFINSVHKCKKNNDFFCIKITKGSPTPIKILNACNKCYRLYRQIVFSLVV